MTATSSGPAAPDPAATAVAADGPWGDESEAVALALEWAAQRVVRPTDPKSTARPASELAVAAGATITAGGIGAAAAMAVFDEVLVPATRAQDDPMNLAYVPAAPTRAAVAFDTVTSSANVFGGLWESGAGAIFAENAALAWLVELLGWPVGAGGCFVPGGTVGNLSALFTAREAAGRRGRRPDGRWQLVCTTGAHSSIRSAAAVLDAEVVLVGEDWRGHLTGPALTAALRRAPRAFAVVASAGTLYAGVERADSFIVDPHKWLFAPYDCCALLYRDPVLARGAHSQRASYLDTIDREVWNPSDLALQLTRRARGLPFWFSLATHGTDRYAAAVERTLATARAVADAIRRCAHLRLVAEPELSVLLFERPGWTAADYAVWSRRLAREGVILCLPTRWRGQTVLRLAFVNPATRADHVAEVLEETTRGPA